MNPPDNGSSPPLLRLRGVTRLFPGVRALDGVDFTLRAGEIHSLLGENGAGKSTLIKVLTGFYRRDAGEIQLAGCPIDPRSPADAQRLGISTVYQEVDLIPDLSVAENLFLGRQPTRLRMIRWREIRQRARQALARLDLALDVERPLRSFSIAIQQMVAIARAVDIEARVLVLDEPTSSLDRHEVTQLFAIMRRLKEQGLGVLFVSHFLDQVYAISDRFTVLRNGRLVGEYAASELPRLQLIEKMLGRPADEPVARQLSDSAGPAVAPAVPLLAARGLARRGHIEPFDLQLRAGEVTGLAGLLGSGRTEIAQLLFGIERPDRGELCLEGRPVRLASPRRAIALGIACLPEDRKSQGIIPDLSVRENILLAIQARRGWLRRLPGREQRRLAHEFITSLRIATPDAEKPVGQLSGGNQQKVILARWLASRPRLLILDEPTRGIDVGAKVEVERLVDQLRREGLAILFISGEHEEVVRASQRVIVLRDRRIIADLTGEQVDIPAIMRLIAEGHPHAPAA